MRLPIRSWPGAPVLHEPAYRVIDVTTQTTAYGIVKPIKIDVFCLPAALFTHFWRFGCHGIHRIICPIKGSPWVFLNQASMAAPFTRPLSFAISSKYSGPIVSPPTNTV